MEFAIIVQVVRQMSGKLGSCVIQNCTADMVRLGIW